MTPFEKLHKLRSKIERIDHICIFLIFGLRLPILIFLYRILYILTGKNFLLPYYSFFFIDNRLYEPMVFCYIPSLILLYFLSAKNCSFFIKVMEKTGIVSVVFCRIAKIECYFYDNRIYGICFLIVYFLAYLYGLYKGFLLEILFLFFRLLLSSYFSFRLFFRVEHENIESTQFLHFSFFQTFYKFHEKLMSDKTQKDGIYLVPICAIVSLYLCRENSLIKYEIQDLEKKCERIIFFLEKTNTEISCQELDREKQNIFSSGKIKPLFFYLSNQFYGNIKGKSESFFKTISTIYKNTEK